MTIERDYYEVLGLAKDAPDDEIKKACRKPSRKYYPDINKEANAEEKSKGASEAYEVSSDPQKKVAYDQYDHAGTDPNYDGGADGFGGFGGGGFSSSGFGGSEDILDSLFGGGGGRSVDPNASKQGADLQYVIQLRFREAVFDVEKEIKYNRKDTCVTCSGNGAKPGTHPETYHKCHGSGIISVEHRTPLGRMMSHQTCDVCRGTGKEIKESCPACHDASHERKTHTVKVNVPAGVEDGQQMCLANQGEAGTNSGPHGDLYIVFRVEDSDIFGQDDAGIYYGLPVSSVQVALGGEVTVPAVHDGVKLKIPAGTQTGTNFCLRGKGAPRLRGGGNGDQHVKVKLVTLKNLSEEQKDALRAFAKAGGQSVIEQQEEGFFDKMKDALGGKRKK